MKLLLFALIVGGGLFWAYRNGVLDPLFARGAIPTGADIGSGSTGVVQGIAESVRGFGNAGWGSQ